MKKASLYSSSGRVRKPERAGAPATAAAADPANNAPSQGAERASQTQVSRWRSFAAQHKRSLMAAGAGVVILAIALARYGIAPPPPPLTQQDIDAAVLHTLETVPLPSRAARAYEVVRRSVVRVHGSGYEQDKEGHVMQGVGTGVVMVDTGIILTNMHVIAGADRIEVEFDDGMESEATVIGVRPEHDLVFLQAK